MNSDNTFKTMEKNFKSYIKQYIINQKISDVTNPIFKYFNNANIKYYIVGGIIRDYILEYEPNDLDIVYEADFDELYEYIKDNFKYHYVANPKFKTIKIYINNNEIDLICAREEEYPYDGALPQVESSSIYADMKRRDFTINSICYSVTENRFIDIFDGIRDIRSKLIRFNNRYSLKDDPTRLFRIIKYKNRYNFKFDELTNDIILEALEQNYLENITNDRMLKEFIKILEEPNLRGIFIDLYKYKILKYFMPAEFGIKFKNRLDNFIQLRNRVDNTLLLLYYIFDEHIPFFIENFNHSKKMNIDLLNVIELKKDILELDISSNASAIYNVFSKYSDNLLEIAYHSDRTKVRELLQYYNTVLKHVTCPITRNDLREAGISDEKRITEILKIVFNDTLDDKNLMLTKEEIIKNLLGR